jgi:hypothetical protein
VAKEPQNAREDQVKRNEDIEQFGHYQDKNAQDQCNQWKHYTGIFDQKHSDHPLHWIWRTPFPLEASSDERSYPPGVVSPAQGGGLTIYISPLAENGIHPFLHPLQIHFPSGLNHSQFWV